jgi:predicted DNA-binding antitoxin AbrB/MazE fold protein
MVRAAKKKSDKKSESFYNDQETKRHKKPAKAVKLSEGPKIKFKVKKNLPVEQEVVKLKNPSNPKVLKSSLLRSTRNGNNSQL